MLICCISVLGIRYGWVDSPLGANTVKWWEGEAGMFRVKHQFMQHITWNLHLELVNYRLCVHLRLRQRELDLGGLVGGHATRCQCCDEERVGGEEWNMGSQTPKTCQLSPITCEFSPVTWLDLGGCGRATRCQCCKAGNDEERVGEGRNAESQIPKSCNLTVITYDFSSATYHLHLVV